MDEIKDILLLFAGSDGGSDKLTPASASISTSALYYPSANHRRANLSLGTIVSRLNFRLKQKSEIILSSFTFELFGQLLRKFMI